MSMLLMVQELRALKARATKAWSVEHHGLTEEDIDDLDNQLAPILIPLPASPIVDYSLIVAIAPFWRPD